MRAMVGAVDGTMAIVTNVRLLDRAIYSFADVDRIVGLHPEYCQATDRYIQSVTWKDDVAATLRPAALPR